jgi:hypothetical protein
MHDVIRWKFTKPFGHKEAQRELTLPKEIFRAPIGALKDSLADGFLCLFVATPQTGSHSVARAPPSGRFSSETSPPCRWTISRTRASPSPVLFRSVPGRGSE